MKEQEYIIKTAETLKDKLITAALFFNGHGISPDILFNIVDQQIKTYEDVTTRQLENKWDRSKLIG